MSKQAKVAQATRTTPTYMLNQPEDNLEGHVNTIETVENKINIDHIKSMEQKEKLPKNKCI